MFLGNHLFLYPLKKPAPIFLPYQYNRKLPYLFGLYECHCLKEFIKCSESSRKNYESLGIFHEHEFSDEKIIKSNKFIRVNKWIRMLCKRKIKIYTNRFSFSSVSALICRFHNSRSAAGNNSIPIL